MIAATYNVHGVLPNPIQCYAEDGKAVVDLNGNDTCLRLTARQAEVLMEMIGRAVDAIDEQADPLNHRVDVDLAAIIGKANR